MDGVHDLGRAAVLHQIAGRSGANGANEHLVVRVHGEDHHRHLRRPLAEEPGGLDAVEHRHRYVHQHHVGSQLFGQLHGRRPVRSFPHDVQTLGLE